MDFWTHYNQHFINPSRATLSYYITFVTKRFTSAKSVQNYIFVVRFLHKQLG